MKLDDQMRYLRGGTDKMRQVLDVECKGLPGTTEVSRPWGTVPKPTQRTLEQQQIWMGENWVRVIMWFSASGQSGDNITNKMSSSMLVRTKYRHISFYCTSLYGALQILHYLHSEGLWQSCIRQVYQPHFSPTAFSQFMSLCHILVVSHYFKPFHYYCIRIYYCKFEGGDTKNHPHIRWQT